MDKNDFVIIPLLNKGNLVFRKNDFICAQTVQYNGERNRFETKVIFKVLDNGTDYHWSTLKPEEVLDLIFKNEIEGIDNG